MILGYLRGGTCHKQEEDEMGSLACSKGHSFSMPTASAGQLLLPFEEEQICILRFHRAGVEGGGPGAEDRRRGPLWREGKVVYAPFGSGGESA